MNAQQVEKLTQDIVKALYENDVALCSVPHGQYETYTRYSRERAAAKIQVALQEVGLL